MTDKFTICNMGLNGRFIKENGKIIEVERVVDLLNKEERLKQSHKEILRDLEATISDKKLLQKEKEELYEENKQLKQQLNRLYNYFEDWYSDMTSANDFNEIWDNVKEDER